MIKRKTKLPLDVLLNHLKEYKGEDENEKV